MRPLTILLSLLLLISSTSHADEDVVDVVTRPIQLKNLSCYLYRPWGKSEGKPILSELFTLDQNANVRVGGVPGQFITHEGVTPSSIFRTRDADYDVGIQDLNGRELIKGHIYLSSYSVRPAYFYNQSESGIWEAGTLYQPNLIGDIMCAPTSYGPPQLKPVIQDALKFLTSKSVPKELSDYVRANSAEVKDRLGANSYVETWGDNAGEILSRQIVLPDTQDEENEYCDKAYTLNFNIFTKKFSAIRGRFCPDSNG